MFQGTVERMTKELMALAPSTMKVKLVALTRYGLEAPSCLSSFFADVDLKGRAR